MYIYNFLEVKQYLLGFPNIEKLLFQSHPLCVWGGGGVKLFFREDITSDQTLPRFLDFCVIQTNT